MKCIFSGQLRTCKNVSNILENSSNVSCHFTWQNWHLCTRVVDPDPEDWIRIQRLCGSGSVLGIRIQGQENKEISVQKMHFLVICLKNFTTKKI
jgi:hypothetical protein